MIIEADETTVVSNMPAGMVTEMTISIEGMAHLMKTLTNLYNDPKLAVIREYFANGLDSHVMAGQTDPVLVSLPNSYNKMFIVQDFGVGMSVDDINNVYSKYGASTKRQSNDQIGAYGLGAKSALAIANQFTLVSVKDGVKATVLVQKSESGINTMSVISVLDTDEPNGVTVSIPVDDVYGFNSKAHEFFRFVDPGLVLVDGYEPTSVYSSATKLDTITVPNAEAFVDLDNSYGPSYVIMGQVAYALSSSNIGDAADRLGIYAAYELRNMPVYFKVGIGDVDLTPNREGLRFTDKTNTLIDALIKDYLEGITEVAQEELDAIEDRFETYDLAERWSNRIGKKLQWRGEDILTSIRTAQPSNTIKRSTYDKSAHGTSYEVNLKTRNDVTQVVVTGQPYDKYRRISNYISDYMEMMDLTGAIKFYFREALDELDNAWATENPNFVFEDFEDMILRVKEHRKVKRAAAKAAMPKALRDRPVKLEYPVILDLDDQTSLTRVPYDEIPADSYYLSANDLNNPLRHRDVFEGSHVTLRLLVTLKHIVGEGATLVFISKSRSVESFKARTKDITGLRNVLDVIPDVQERINELLTEEVLVARNFSLRHSSNVYLSRFDADQIAAILDDEVREQLSPVDPELEAQGDLAMDIYNAVTNFGFDGVQLTLPTVETRKVEVDTAIKYPLTKTISYYTDPEVQEHMVRYMNMVYTDQLTLVDA